MPMYEYECAACCHKYEQLRSMMDADQPAVCPDCGSQKSHRLLPSRFAAHSAGRLVVGGSACGSCAASAAACRACRGVGTR